MRTRLALLCAAGLWLAAPAARADAAASLEVLQRCVAGSETVPPSTAPRAAIPPPSAELLARCPGLDAAITGLHLDSGLPPDWRAHLSAAQLAGLVQLVRRYQGRPPSAAPRPALLPVAALRARALPAHSSWWQRFKAWLTRRLLSPGGPGPGLGQWLTQLTIPQLLVRVMLYLTTAAVLVMAAIVVARELRAAGRLRARPEAARPGHRAGATAAPVPPEVPAIEAVLAAPLHERAIVLLRLLVQALLRSGRLAGERPLTYRELTERSAFDDEAQRGRFRQLALLAESDRYGTGCAAAGERERQLAAGRALYEELSR